MKVTVKGETYTGAHFRGFADPFDGRAVQMVLIGHEHNITAYINENLGWGETENVSLTQWVSEAKADNLGHFDGAGGVFQLLDKSGNELYNWKMLNYPGDDLPTEYDDLGTVDVNQLPRKSFFGHVVRLLKQKENG